MVVRVRITARLAGAVALLVALAGARKAGAQTITGLVTDATTKAAMRGAGVVLLDDRNALVARTQTAGDGRYTFAAKAGSYRLRFEIPGYRIAITQALSLKGGQTLDYSMALAPLPPMSLDTVVVEGKSVPRHLLDFYLRRSRHVGSFLTPEDLDRWNPQYTTDIVRHLEGFDIVYDPQDPQRRTIRNTRQGFSMGRACTPAIYLNGAYVGNADTYDVDSFLWTSQIEAVESYPSAARVPTEFGVGGAKCGAIVFWTKQG